MGLLHSPFRAWRQRQMEQHTLTHQLPLESNYKIPHSEASGMTVCASELSLANMAWLASIA